MANLPYSSTANLPFGSRTITINSVTYVARNWAPQKSTRETRRNDANGNEAAFRLDPEPTTQSGLTLQLATTSTAIPTMGQEFTVDALVYVITSVSKVENEGEFQTVDIAYKSKVLPTD